MEIVLNRNETLTIDGDPRRQTVICRSGALWLTQQNDPRDYILRGGESLDLTQRGLVVIWAIDPSGFDIAPTPQASPLTQPLTPCLVCR